MYQHIYQDSMHRQRPQQSNHSQQSDSLNMLTNYMRPSELFHEHSNETYTLFKQFATICYNSNNCHHFPNSCCLYHLHYSHHSYQYRTRDIHTIHTIHTIHINTEQEIIIPFTQFTPLISIQNKRYSYHSHYRWLAELLSGYEMGHCGRPAVGFTYIPNGKVVHSIFSLWPFSSVNYAPKGPERKRNKPRRCWPAIFASILFSEKEKGQRLCGLRRAIVHAHCTCHEPRAMSKHHKRAETGYHFSSDLLDFFDSLQRAEIIIGFSQVNSTW